MNYKKIIKQLTLIKNWKNLNKIKTYKRNIILTKNMIDTNIKVHNGIRFFDIKIKKNMLGHKLGEFVPTRLKKNK